MIKAVTIDFDGTLVKKDMLSIVCSIVGKQEESEKLNNEFHMGKRPGSSALIERINLLRGVSLVQVRRILDENLYLVEGAETLLAYLNQHDIVSIVCSGNILPILEHYQRVLNIGYIVGTSPTIEQGVIIGITDVPVNFKLASIRQLLQRLKIHPDEALSIGDSPADRSVFAFVGKERSVAINPKGGIETAAASTITDLSQVIGIIEQLGQEK